MKSRAPLVLMSAMLAFPFHSGKAAAADRAVTATPAQRSDMTPTWVPKPAASPAPRSEPVKFVAPEAEDFPPLPPKRPATPIVPFVEKGPAELSSYVEGNRQPRYMRINAGSYEVRTTPDFTRGRTDNVAFKAGKGDLYVVKSVQPMSYGAAVQIRVKEELRWIYVPYKNKDNFQFCESEACFGALAQSLDFFAGGKGVSLEQAQTCGVSVGVEGLTMPVAAAPPRVVSRPVVPLPPRRPLAAPATPPNYSAAMSVKPLWETAKGARGAAWTKMLTDSLDKYGRGLLKQRFITDAQSFCPNFSRLTAPQKKEFWVHLFNGIAKYESVFELGVPAFKEPRRGEKGRQVFSGPIEPDRDSMGLFMLSYKSSSARVYQPGCSGISWAKDRGKRIENRNLTIYDAKAQMDCAVTIMNNWVPQDGAIGLRRDRGGARFWSTLRSTNIFTKEVIGSLKRFTPCWK